ncbi:arginyl-tRNA synthetase, mitochondrial [Oratosquilla oratoria]|uniref:arginyl-tRNA synthetase, mitochondrial n=1 Tax=Oratosquilla oratoria TaxID=337810 RepID=UPI003F77674E
MASKFRSIISNKIVQALDRFPLRGEGLKPGTIAPFVKVNSSSRGSIEFQVSVESLQQQFGVGDSNKKFTGKETFERYGSELIKKLDIDDTICGVYITASKKGSLLNFKVNSQKIVEEVINIVSHCPATFWQRSSLINRIPKEKVVVEFSSPNIAKPFHVGHLRSTILGSYIANIHEAVGHDVTRINYLGDWGTQFGLLKYGFQRSDLSPSDLKDDATRKLYEVYVCANKMAEEDPGVLDEARRIFNQMENGSKDELSIWQVFRDVSIQEFKELYKKLNITFDKYDGESMYSANKCKEIISILDEKGILTQLPDGRKVYELTPKQRITVVKSDGSSIYLSRDIAAAIDRQQRYRFDKLYYVVDNSQSDHFVGLFRILKHMGYKWAEGMHHVKFGRIRGMSTRKGTVVFLQDLLQEAKELMIQKQHDSTTTPENVLSHSEETAGQVAVSAVMIADMKQRRQRDYDFSWDKVLQAQGDTGVKLHYVHSRLCSLEQNCGVNFNLEADLSSITEPSALALIREIARFDEIVCGSLKELEPCILVNYLFRFSGLVNKALQQLTVKNAPKEVGEARLLLFLAARHCLAAGIQILGPQPLEQM